MELFPSKLTSILGIPGENPTEISKTYTEPSRGKISISYSHLKSLCWLERIESNKHYEQPLAKVKSSSRSGHLTAKYVLHFEQGAGTRRSLKSRKAGQGPRWR